MSIWMFNQLDIKRTKIPYKMNVELNVYQAQYSVWHSAIENTFKTNVDMNVVPVLHWAKQRKMKNKTNRTNANKTFSQHNIQFDIQKLKTPGRTNVGLHIEPVRHLSRHSENRNTMKSEWWNECLASSIPSSTFWRKKNIWKMKKVH